MKRIQPRFYRDFHCIASRCTDSCCIGWEIDVDEESLEAYDAATGEFGEKLRANIARGEESAHFVLGVRERCPFLNERNLCEIYIRLGEECLCEICREHPRFYAGDGGVTLAGQGLVCEEAARLWLETPLQLVAEDDGEEPEDWASAELAALTAALEDPAAILPTAILAAEYAGLRAIFTSLEAMDPAYPARYSVEPPAFNDPRLGNLAAYFLYRYWFELGGELAAAFAAVSCVMIASLGGELADAARMYSGEVEYDTENVEKICDYLEEHGCGCFLR